MKIFCNERGVRDTHKKLPVAFIKKKKLGVDSLSRRKNFLYLFALWIFSSAIVEIGVTIAASNNPSVLSSLIRHSDLI